MMTSYLIILRHPAWLSPRARHRAGGSVAPCCQPTPKDRTRLSGEGELVLLILKTLKPAKGEKTGHTCPLFPPIPVSGEERALPPDPMLRHGGMSFGVPEAGRIRLR